MQSEKGAVSVPGWVIALVLILAVAVAVKISSDRGTLFGGGPGTQVQIAREEAEDIARNASLACQVYAGDHDLKWPASLEGEAIKEYVKSESDIGGFVYQKPEWPTVDKTPPRTPIGTVETKYGTVIEYADGTQDWKPK